MKACVVQMNSQADKAANLEQAFDLIERAALQEKPDLIVLPETFTLLSGDLGAKRDGAEQVPHGPVCRALAEAAKRHQFYLHAGSMLEDAGARLHNTSVAFAPDGTLLAIYRKMHLFDVETPGGKQYLESAYIAPGDQLVTYQADGHTVGCSICYDLRFATLYRRLRDAGSAIIVAPSAFTLQTGKDHWDLLVRARAVETQSYVLAPNQTGSFDDGKRACYGHSMIVDPWGHVIARCSDTIGYACARLNFDYLASVRARMPVANHHVLD
ncbi:MAG: carbon-nitrogen hydrolase family protein [Geminicoccaceae bacterium]